MIEDISVRESLWTYQLQLLRPDESQLANQGFAGRTRCAPGVGLTYCSITAQFQYPLSRLRGERLCTCNDSLGTMYHTPSTWELREYCLGGEDCIWSERHREGCYCNAGNVKKSRMSLNAQTAFNWSLKCLSRARSWKRCLVISVRECLR